MRYLHDKELEQYVERELLPGLAEDCITEFHERFQLSLDTSPASLQQIDHLIASNPNALDRTDFTGPIGAYLGAVFSGTDGARWAARFRRDFGTEGYKISRLRIYDDEIDVFSLAEEALQGERRLTDSYAALHRPW